MPPRQRSELCFGLVTLVLGLLLLIAYLQPHISRSTEP